MSDTIKNTFDLGLHWPTEDPFLFCAHHFDNFPEGTDSLGPKPEEQVGRHMGQDFSNKDGWSMYHGSDVPGFPHHPHRGFETVTIVRNGVVDHRDSLGAAARFGKGDVQWMTAGRGVVHSEIFPLIHQDQRNPMEMFQIWLNLPKSKKMVDPAITMFWSEDVPVVTEKDADGHEITTRLVAGRIGSVEALNPPADSWASVADTDVRIMTVSLSPGATWTLSASSAEEVSRNLYFFEGGHIEVEGQTQDVRTGMKLEPKNPLTITNTGEVSAELLLLEGRPIGEPVVQQGPFVMNSPGEIRQAMVDYQRTGFGGWPWEAGEEAHPVDTPRFALHAHGEKEYPDSQA